ncbi:MAG TPA: type 1 glutamine amidotransferase [Caulobacteraceae bacterium]|jgi:GMP synthase-like glutamine amidotransferase
MKIGILAAGRPPRALIPAFGDYVSMFEHLLAGRGYDWSSYDVPAGGYPDRPEACDAYIVTGAAAGVYDGDPWIGELLEFLRAARGRAKLVGVCFGHQAMAQAFGGEVMKADKGWGIGLHRYVVAEHPGWMDASPAFSLSASHQDQVIEPPPGARVLAGSDFCPNGMLAYDGTSISCQLHPEFAPEYSIALIEGRKGQRFAEAQADAAIESLHRPDDHAKFAAWVAKFLAG